MHTIPLQVLTLEKEGYHLLVEVLVFGNKHHMVVDTGASKTVFDKHMLLQQGVAETALITSNLLSTGLGTNEMKSETFVLEDFHISGWWCRQIEVAILDLSTINFAYSQMSLPPVIGVLGGDILLNYGGVIDYKKRTLTLNDRKRKKS